MEGIIEHLEKAYGHEHGLFEGVEFTRSDADPDGRRLIGKAPDGTSIVVTARPVGGRNSGVYRDWVTMSRGEWRSVRAPRPAGWRSYTVMVGYDPGDVDLWWSAVYDNDILKDAQVEEMDGGRWIRIAPEFASDAIVEDIDYAPTMFEVKAEGAPVMESREVVFETIMEGPRFIKDPGAIKHLTGVQLAVIDHEYRMVQPIISAWLNVRRQQSGQA